MTPQPLVCLDAGTLGMVLGLGCLLIMLGLGLRWGLQVRDRVERVEVRLSRLQRQQRLEEETARTRQLAATDPPTPP